MAIALALLGGACGYTLQNSRGPLEQKGIRRIYVTPIGNNSYDPAADYIVYNAVVRALSAHGRVRIVEKQADADAILDGTVIKAIYTMNASTSVTSVPPGTLSDPTLNLPPLYIAQEYSASMTVGFQLRWPNGRLPSGSKTPIIWASTFTRQKLFPGSYFASSLGTTNATVNNSQFESALFDIAKAMSEDLHESMLAMF